MARYGTIEMGGTKTSVAIGSSPDDLEPVLTIPTTAPTETLGQVIDHLRAGSPERVGIASFGPVELRTTHVDYGKIRVTPKEGWSHVDVVGPIQSALGVPIGFDTDVNGAALGEWRWGAGQGLGSVVYVTVGTGIGGGAVLDGEPIHGLGHPEMGHVSVRRHPDDHFEGVCPLHGDCLEGMANGPSLEARFGISPDGLCGEDLARAIDLEAFYLAQLMRDLIYVLAPEQIIVGGSVAKIPALHEEISRNLVSELASYPGLPEHGFGFVVPPGLGSLSGLAGGLVLAERALTD